MSHKNWIASFLLLLVLAAVMIAQPVSANPSSQVIYQTPTALPDGRIIYVVQANDTCLRIELLTGVTVEQIRTLNKLDQDCTLSIGKELVLAFVTPAASPTSNPNITPTALLPTPTPFKGNGQICALLFEDINGNAFQDDTEPYIPGGAVSISDRRGQVSETGMTASTLEDLMCIEVPEGEYTISIAIPDGLNATTMTNLPLTVQAGDQAILNFGAQVSSKAVEAATEAPTAATGGNNLLMALLGGMFVFLGLGLGVYIVVMRRG